MAETDKLRCLCRGLKPSVVEKLWSLKPTMCDGFLEDVKDSRSSRHGVRSGPKEC